MNLLPKTEGRAVKRDGVFRIAIFTHWLCFKLRRGFVSNMFGVEDKKGNIVWGDSLAAAIVKSRTVEPPKVRVKPAPSFHSYQKG